MAVLDEIKTPEEDGKLVVNLLSGESCKTDEKSYDSNVNGRIKSKTKWIIIVAIGIVIIVSLAISFPVYVLVHKEADIPVRCNPNLKIPNGIIFNRTESFVQGDEISIKCNDGYIRNGSSVIACMSSAHWNETPICVPKQCKKLRPPENAEVKLPHLVSNVEEVTISCLKGFYLVGNNTVLCHDNETWSTVPSCKPVNCGYPTFVKNGNILDIKGTTYNKTFRVKCNNGYTLKGDVIAKCQSNRLWSSVPKCGIVSCGTPLIPQNAYIQRLEGTVFKKSVSFRCAKGFALIGNSSSTCQSNGEWSSYPECKRTCPLDINIPNGRIIHSTGATVGHIAHIECADKHKINGSKVIVCLPSGQWNETPICIRKQCPKLQPPSNSDIKLQHLASNIDEVIVSCHQGYRLEGTPTVVCQDDETWSPVPLCKLVDCGRPEDIRNGGIYKLTKTTYNFTFEVQCGHGYDLKENSQVRCNSDGQWSASPKCEPVLCGPPILPTNAYPENMGGEYVFGKTVSFQCVEGFSIEGAKWATCQGDGKWSDLPKCVQTKEYPVRKGHNSVNTQASSSSRLHSDIGLIKCIFVSVTLILNYLYSKI